MLSPMEVTKHSVSAHLQWACPWPRLAARLLVCRSKAGLGKAPELMMIPVTRAAPTWDTERFLQEEVGQK